jgi:hypothetical protein
MEIGVTDLVLKYGLPIVVMALIVMILVGIVKIFTKGIVNKKEHSEKVKKWLSKLYLALSLVFSYIVVLLYYWLILKENCWTMAALRDTGIVWTVTSPLYQIYKQFGGRKLLVAVVSSIQKLFKGKDKNVDDLLNIVMSVLENDAPLLTDAQKETIQSELKEKLNGKNESVSKEETESK